MYLFIINIYFFFSGETPDLDVANLPWRRFWSNDEKQATSIKYLKWLAGHEWKMKRAQQIS